MPTPTQKQDFFRTSLAEDVGFVGAGTLKLNQLPTATAGRLVLSATNATKREIIRYSSLDTAAGGVVVATAADRGLGGTAAQIHKQNEPVQMNITAGDYNDLFEALALKAENFVELDDVDTAAQADGRLVQWNATTGKHEYVDPPTLGAAGIATETEAVEGTNNTKLLTPLRAKQARDAALAALQLKQHSDVDPALAPVEGDLLVQQSGKWKARSHLLALPTVKTPATYIPAFLTGGTAAETNYALWNDLASASFRITLDGTSYDVTGINLTSATTLADVASLVQTALRAVTSTLATVVLQGNQFVVSSANTTSASAVAPLTTATTNIGTDISGAGAQKWLDCAGAATVTNKVLNQAADNNRLPILGADGRLDQQLLPAALVGGNNADALHEHSAVKKLAFAGVAGEALAAGDAVRWGAKSVTVLAASETSGSSWLNMTGTSYRICQSFTTGANARFVDRVILRFARSGTPRGNVYVRLRAANANDEPTGSALGETGRVNFLATSAANDIPFTFAVPVAVTPNTKYCLEIVYDNVLTLDATNFLNFAYRNTNNYAGGAGKWTSNDGSTWTALENSGDWYFQVYECQEDPTRLYKTNAADRAKTGFVGFAQLAAIAGANVNIATRGLADQFTGLTAGKLYYLTNTAGQISTAPGTYKVAVGRAATATALWVEPGLRVAAEYYYPTSFQFYPYYASSVCYIRIPIGFVAKVVRLIFYGIDINSPTVGYNSREVVFENTDSKFYFGFSGNGGTQYWWQADFANSGQLQMSSGGSSYYTLTVSLHEIGEDYFTVRLDLYAYNQPAYNFALPFCFVAYG